MIFNLTFVLLYISLYIYYYKQVRSSWLYTTYIYALYVEAAHTIMWFVIYTDTTHHF